MIDRYTLAITVATTKAYVLATGNDILYDVANGSATLPRYMASECNIFTDLGDRGVFPYFVYVPMSTANTIPDDDHQRYHYIIRLYYFATGDPSQ